VEIFACAKIHLNFSLFIIHFFIIHSKNTFGARGGTSSATVLLAPSVLLSDVESCDDRTVALDIVVHQILEKISSATNHLKESATAVVVVGVSLEMLVERIDSVGKNRDLYLGGSGIAFASCVLGDDCLLFSLSHCFSPHEKYFYARAQRSVGEVHFVPLSENRAGVIREELYHNYKEK
jgi:hypothetical protein